MTATSQKTKRRTEQFDYEGYTLVTSASQVESFLTCPRKHWFRSSRRLPVLPSPAARLGELIHDRFEAWMTGTELDDLFPPFWGIEETPRDLAMVKHHVRAAIESQAITRIPGGRAEQPFQVDVGEGASLIGFLDLSAIYPDRVYYLDFKSKKNLKYAKTPAKLKQDPQMLLGAACLFVEAAQSGQMPDRAELTHFYMQMDPADMKQKAVTVVVPRSEVEDFFTGTFLPVRDQMLKLKPVPLEDWEKVPHTTDSKNCRFCDFNTICSRAETPERYKARIDKMTAATEPPKPQPQQPTMGMFDDMAAIVTGGSSATVVTPTATAAAPAPTATQPTLTEAPADARVPWADPKCQMCGGLGIAPEGGPCPLCEFTAAASRKPSQFTVERVPGEGLRVNGTLYRLTTPVAQARATTPPPAPAAPAAQEDPSARAQARVEGPAEPPPAAAAPAAPARRGPGRPPGAKNKKTLEREASAAVQAAVAAGQDPRGVLTAPAAPVAPVARDESRKQEPPAALEGFIIVRGAGIDRLQASALGLAGLVVRNGAEWLHDLTEQVAKAKGTPFYAIPFFDRRDAVAAAARDAAEKLDGILLIPPINSPEMDAALASLLIAPRCLAAFSGGAR